MYRIDNSTAAPALPTVAPVGPNVDGFFTKGDPTTATPATIVDDDWLNAIQEEISYVIEFGGDLVLDKEDRTQLYQAIRKMFNGIFYGVSSSSPNTYTATMTPTISDYATGQIYLVKFTNGNTGTTTVNLDSVGAKTVKRLDGLNLLSGDIYDGMVAMLVYDGTNMQLINAQTIKALHFQNNTFKYAADSGSANAIIASITPAPTSYVTGMGVLIKMAAANSGASTINLNSLGVKNIKRADGTALQAGDLKLGQIVELVYDGTNFQLINRNTAADTGRFLAFKVMTASGTWTPSTGCTQAFVIAVAGGGGGMGGGPGIHNGSAGGDTIVGSYCSATGGTGGNTTLGSVGGIGTGGDWNLQGADGFTQGNQLIGAAGGATIFGGAGAATWGAFPGNSAKANSGAGGAGGPAISGATVAGSGGAAGGVAYKHITGLSSASPISVTIGTGGPGGTGGNTNGGPGADGILLIWEYS